MKRFIYFLAYFMLCYTLCFAQKKDMLWAKKLPHTLLPIEIRNDAVGNIYITGTMWESCSFDNTTITTVGNYDAFVVKYDRDGNQLWVKNTGGINREESGGMAIDHSGNVYICGHFKSPNDTSSIFGQQVVSRGEEDIFVAKLDANGNTEWVKTGGGKYDDKFFTASMAIDANDNVYISGQIRDTAYFGNITVWSVYASDAFVVSYDKNGNERWGQTLQDPLISHFGRAVTIDNGGNVYATGMIGNYDGLYIVKYDAQGAMQWIKNFNSPGQSYGIAAAPNGNIYVSGGMKNTMTLGSKILTTNVSGFQSFVFACDNAGNVLWADTVGGGSVYPTHIAADAYSNAYIGSEQAIYTRYDKDGNRLWQEQEPAANAMYAFDEDGYMYIMGETARLGSQSYLPDTANFLVKFAQFPTNVATAKPAIQVSVYPNPATNMLTITAQASGSYHIMALNGTAYLSGNSRKEKTVDISALPAGIYILQYEAGKETAYTMFEKR